MKTLSSQLRLAFLAIAIASIAETAPAQSSFTWNGGSSSAGNWSDSANWGGSGPANPQGYLNFDGSARLNNTNDFAAGSGGFQIYFKSTGGAFNLYGAGINFFDFSSVDPNIQNEGATTQTINFPITNANTHVSGSVRILNINANASPAQGPLVFNGAISTPNDSLARVINISGGGAITFNGVISDGGSGSAQGITQLGSGTTTLAGANTYNGQTTISAGTVSISANNNLGGSGTAVSLNGGTLKITTGHTGTHPITVGASGGTINVNAGTGQYYLHTVNTLLGSGALTLTGSGTLTANSGNLRVDQTNAYSGNLIMQNGGIFEYGVASAVAGNAPFTINNNGELAVNSGVTCPNTITVSGGTSSVLSFENGTAGIFSSNITLNANLIVGLRDWYNNATVRGGVISGAISGTGGISVNSGTGTGGILALSGTASGINYSGGTTISNAIILAGASTPISGTTANSANTPAALQASLGVGAVTIKTNAALQGGYHASSTGLAYTLTNSIVLDGGAIWGNDAYQHLSGPITVNGTGGFLGSTYSGASGTYGPASGYNKGLFVDGLVGGSGPLTIEQAGAGGNGAVAEVNGWGNATGNSFNVGIVIFTNNANTYSGTVTVYPYSAGGGSYLCVNGATTLQNATINLVGNNTGTTKLYGASPLTFLTGLGSITLGALAGGADVVLTGMNEGTAVSGGDAVALTVGGNNANTIYSGVLSGNGSLTKTGTGTMTNTAVNTYSGTTTISGGKLQLSNAGAAQSSTVSIGVANGLAFSSGIGSFNIGGLSGSSSESLTDVGGSAVILNVGSNNASTTYSGVLSGSGSLTKSGTGTLTLGNSANSYSGGTTNNGGTLMNDAGGSTGATGTITPFGVGSLTVNGATVQLGHNVGTHNNTVFVITNAFVVNNGTIYEEDGIHHLTGAIAIGSSGATLGATYNGGSGDLNKGLFIDGVMTGSGALAVKQSGINTGHTYNSSIVYFSNTNTYSGTITLTPMSGTAGGNYLGINASMALSNATINLGANNTSSAQQFGSSPLVFNTGIGSATLGGLSGTANVVLTGYNETTHAYGADSIALTVGNNNSSTAYSGVMSGGGSLTKAGSGTFTISGVNTYTGNTTVNGGTLTILTNGQLASGSYAGNISIGSGATFNYNSSAAQTLSGTISGSGTLQQSGSGTMTLSGVDNCATVVSGGKLAVSSAQTGTGALTVNSGGDVAITISGTSQWAPSTLTFGSGTSTLEFNGLNSTTVAPLNPASVANSGTVTVTVNSGTFSVGSTYPLIANVSSTNGYSLASAPLLVLGVAAHLTTTTISSVTYLAMQVDSVSDIWTGAGANWDSTTSGNWTGHAATYSDGDNVLFDDTATANTNVTVAAQVNPANIAVNNNANAYSITASGGNYIGGSGALMKTGTNALTLAGPNTYSGGTTLSAGRLNINDGGTSSANSAIGTGPLTIAAGTIDDTSSGDVTLLPNNAQNWNGDFTYAGSHNLNLGTGAVTPSGNRQITVVSNTLTVGGAIGGGAVSLTKTGNGTLVLGGANTYSGGTTLSNGTVIAANTAALGASGASVTFAGTSGTTTLDVQTDGGDNAYNVNLGSAAVGSALASDVKTGSVGINHTLGTLAIGNTTLNVVKGTNVASGSPSVTFASLNLSAGVAGTAVLNPGSASLSIGSASIALNNSAKTLQLDGTNTGNTVTGTIANGLNTVSVTKANTGTWTLSGANTYSGATTISGGTLNVSGSIGPVGSSGVTTVGSAAASAVLNVSGNMNQKNFFVGNASGAVGVVYHTAGTVTVTNGGGDNFCVGNIAGGYGYYNLSGGNILANGLAFGGENNSGSGFSGTGGNGLLEITGGFLNDIGWVVASRGTSTETGVLNVFSGALSYAGGGIVNCWGSGGQVGIVNVLGGVVTNSTDVGFNLNQSANTGNTAVLNLNGGVVQANGIIGTSGQVNFNGGTLRASKTTTAFLTGLGSARIYPGGATIHDNGYAVTVGQALIAPTGSGVSSVTITNGGAGYIAPPIISITNATGDTTGSGATAIAQVDLSTGGATSGQVTNVIITCPGVNYTAAPVFVLSGGGATAQAVVGGTLAANSSGGLTKNGAGNLILTGANTFAGGIVVNGGALQISSDAQLGAIPGSPAVNITLNGGALYNNNSTPIVNTNRTISLGASGGYLQAGWGPANSNVINAVITGVGGLGINWDAAAVVLNATNNYQGNTTIGTTGPSYWANASANPTLKLGTDNALPYGASAGNLIFGTSANNNTATLDLNGHNAQINGLIGATNGIIDNLSGGGSYVLTLGNNDQNSTFGGVIKNTSGTLALTKIGAGTLTLSNANTYTGNTTVGAGKLALSGNGSLASTSITVLSNAAFDISGVTPSGYSLGSSGTLTLGIDKVGSILSQGRAVLTGKTITYGGSLAVTATGDAIASGDSFTLFTNASSYSGWFTNVTVPALANGISWDTNNLATTGTLDIYTFTTTTLSVSTLMNTAATVSATKLTSHASSSRGTPVAAAASTPSHGTASVSAGALTYMPTTGYSGADSFTVTFQDGHGWQTMTVNVTVNSQNVGPQLTTVNAGGFGSFTASGSPSTAYTVQISTNLTDLPPFNDYLSITSAPNGVINFTDTVSIADHGGEAFYRLKQYVGP